MRTNIEIDDKLLARAARLTKVKTKKELIAMALEALIKQQQRRKMLGFEGKLTWEGNLEEWRK